MKRLTEGRQVVVRYDPEDPTDVYPGRGLSNVILPVVIVVGMFFAGLGTAILIGNGTLAKVLDLVGGS